LNFKLVAKTKKKEQELNLLAKVLRCDLIEPELGIHHVGLQFLDIRQQQQDLIMAFLFERMVEIKRKR
jgi:c-di-GMP-binding flagellar brake protein YcgR